MATITAFIRSSANKPKVNVRFRIRDSRSTQLFYKSDIQIEPDFFDPEKEQYKARVINIRPDIRIKINTAISDTKIHLAKLYNQHHPTTSAELLRLIQAEDDKPLERLGFYEQFDLFVELRNFSPRLQEHWQVLKRRLMRYELYRNIALNLDTMTMEDVHRLELYLLNEHEIIKSRQYAHIAREVPTYGSQKKRGQNTVNGLIKKLRSFFNYAIKTKITTNDPFLGYTAKPTIYGTPIFLTKDERNTLYTHDFSDRPGLAVQRDIFIFHCLVGCRVGDLYKLTTSSVINGAIEYVQQKTKEHSPETVRVPLNATALEIIEKYRDRQDDIRLLPYISFTNYNEAIKEMIRLAGIDRMVTVLDSVTRCDKQVPIYEVASTHMARRTFIGNLYKQVQDPNLIASLSGHSEGSRAFARYRTIDEDMKKDLVKLLD